MVQAKWALMEVFKFSMYLSIPITMTFGLVYNPDRMEKITSAFGYVEYPPEGPKPPTLEEIMAMKAAKEAEYKKKQGWFSRN